MAGGDAGIPFVGELDAAESPQTRGAVWKPNEAHPELTETEFSVEMTANGWLYRYSLAYNAEALLREELWRDEVPLYRIDQASKTYDFEGIGQGSSPDASPRRIFAEECTDEEGSQTCTLLSRMGIFHGLENRELAEVLLALGWLQMFAADNLTPEDSLLSLSIRMNNENGENALREVERLLKMLDVGEEGLKPTPAFRQVMRALSKKGPERPHLSCPLDHFGCHQSLPPHGRRQEAAPLAERGAGGSAHALRPELHHAFRTPRRRAPFPCKL